MTRGKVIIPRLEGHGDKSSPTFISEMCTGVVDENSAHELRGDAKEMRPPLPIHRTLLDKLEVGFMDQSSRLECMVSPLSAHVGARQTT